MIFVHETDFRNLILNFFHFWSSSNRKFIQKSDAAIVRNQESDFNAIALPTSTHNITPPRLSKWGSSDTGISSARPIHRASFLWKSPSMSKNFWSEGNSGVKSAGRMNWYRCNEVERNLCRDLFSKERPTMLHVVGVCFGRDLGRSKQSRWEILQGQIPDDAWVLH